MKTAFRKWYNKSINKWIPGYGVFPLLLCFSVNCFIYWGCDLIMRDKKHFDFTSAIDRQVPFVKEWIIIYFICYVFWAINYILITREGKESCYRFAFADLLSRLICGIFFILLPTTNIRPTVYGDDIFSILMRFLYTIDSPTNLFPSIHCLVSWYCFIGLRKSKKVPFWYKVFSLIFTLLVCASTQFTKQHYLIDIAGGILIAEICYYIAWHTPIYIGIGKIFTVAERRIFGVANYDE
jgi:membrane-associated phospholipid phosphatase